LGGTVDGGIMASRTRAFWVGAFVLTGILLAVVALIYLGSADWLRPKNLYVTYFDTTVQGLSIDSEVKYRGVSVGRVKGTRIAPDGRLVEVTLDMQPQMQITPDLRVGLTLAGITGMKYLELNSASPELADRHPTLSFRPPHPVIPSVPSGAQQVEESLRALYNRLMALDIEGVLKSSKEFMNAGTRATAGLDSLLRSGELTGWTRSLTSVGRRADSLLAAFDAAHYDLLLDSTLTRLDDASLRFEHVMTRLDRETEGLHIRGRVDSLLTAAGEAVAGSRELVRRTGYSSTQLMAGAQATLLELNTALDRVNSILLSLESYPSNILYTAPPKEEK
jgi:phospholipid/cholesterol/gamma-HCH transport system substrate-binding protein